MDSLFANQFRATIAILSRAASQALPPRQCGPRVPLQFVGCLSTCVLCSPARRHPAPEPTAPWRHWM
jgi:hypothetical protein